MLISYYSHCPGKPNCGRLCLGGSPWGGREGLIDICSEIGHKIIFACAFFSEESLSLLLDSQSGPMISKLLSTNLTENWGY